MLHHLKTLLPSSVTALLPFSGPRAPAPEEPYTFTGGMEDWWSPTGPFRILQAMNPARLAFMVPYFQKGQRILDVGCGGGLLCEPLARLGFNVTGLDATPEAIAAAQQHAALKNLSITYTTESLEALHQHSDLFDAVTLMELLEHVDNPQQLITEAVSCLAPGGVVIFSTINRTVYARWLAIWLAENVLHWAPKGVHQYEKFIEPYEMSVFLEHAGCQVMDLKGITYKPLSGQWVLSDDLRMNYIGMAQKT